jgi:hypothetical protein
MARYMLISAYLPFEEILSSMKQGQEIILRGISFLKKEIDVYLLYDYYLHIYSFTPFDFAR